MQESGLYVHTVQHHLNEILDMWGVCNYFGHFEMTSSQCFAMAKP